MRRHPEIGAEIVAPVAKLSNVAPLIRAHQEKYDGSGYPNGLREGEIPLGARILAVVDAFSAITDNRVYRQARSEAEAVEELRRCSGSQFDPEIVDAFLKVLESDG
jgi:response regulator RpfG family c-di-GMP phosphodiesterase